MNPIRPTLFSYNTVERLLRGDFFHTVDWATVSGEVSGFPADWAVVGIGTTNWFKRNGEIIVEGDVQKTGVYWSDPEGGVPMHVIEINHEQPDRSRHKLITPSVNDQTQTPAFPFLAIAVCDPATRQSWQAPATDDLHAWIVAKIEELNIGLAAIRVNGLFSVVDYATAFYLPLEGLDLSGGYNAKDNLKFASLNSGSWSLGGIYAVNPTIQRVISVEGHPLHLHGYETASRCGGHIIKIRTSESVTVDFWPIKDLVMEIKNLDVAWQPIRNLALE